LQWVLDSWLCMLSERLWGVKAAGQPLNIRQEVVARR
jgi:hypothetical protein